MQLLFWQLPSQIVVAKATIVADSLLMLAASQPTSQVLLSHAWVDWSTTGINFRAFSFGQLPYRIGSACGEDV
jgi:hypothetical protein